MATIAKIADVFKSCDDIGISTETIPDNAWSEGWAITSKLGRTVLINEKGWAVVLHPSCKDVQACNKGTFKMVANLNGTKTECFLVPPINCSSPETCCVFDPEFKDIANYMWDDPASAMADIAIGKVQFEDDFGLGELLILSVIGGNSINYTMNQLKKEAEEAQKKSSLVGLLMAATKLQTIEDNSQRYYRHLESARDKLVKKERE